MTVVPIASGSAGNCIALAEDGECLLLDCGLRWAEISRSLGALRPSAALVTHEHQDHCRGAAEADRRGINVYCSPGTGDAMGCPYSPLDAGVSTELPNHWWVTPVAAIHPGAASPLGFVLDSPRGNRAVYLCDTAYVSERFAGVTHWLIEANYDPALVPHDLNERQYAHVRDGHMSIDEALALLAANDISRTREVWLLHLSDRHSDAADFRRRVMGATGLPCYIAPAWRGSSLRGNRNGNLA